MGNAQYVTTVTDYVGNIVYKYGELYMILLPDGYIDDVYGRYDYVKDHLGNNRVVINDAGQVVQTNHYYAFAWNLTKEIYEVKMTNPINLEVRKVR